MNWRLHLSNHPLRRVHMLAGEPKQIAVSDSRARTRIYDLIAGGHYCDIEVDLDLLDNDVPEERREGFAKLRAPNGSYLPFVEFGASHMYTSNDGNLRLIHDLNAGISLEIDDQILPLDVGVNATVTMATLERELGTIAAVTDDQRMHIFQQQTRISTFPLEGKTILQMFLINGGTQLVLVQPSCLQILDTSGNVLREQSIHYTVRLAAMSPNGEWLVIGDADYQLLRLYNSELIPVRQQHAIDLIQQAQQLQLFATLPPPAAPLAAVDIANEGTLAFATAGMLCLTQISRLTELPQPRPLL